MRRLLLSLVLLGALAPAAPAAPRRVPVPPVAQGLRAEYDLLRRSDFAVRLPAFTAQAGRLPGVRAVVPAPGTRRPVGSAVRLVLDLPPARRSGRGRSVTVPAWHGWLLSWAVGWAHAHGLRLVIRFSRLLDGTATTLLANYEIVRQSVPAGHRARTVIVRAVPLLPVRYGACRFPWGATLVARDAQAALALVGTTSNGNLYGCAAASGGVVPAAVASLDFDQAGTLIDSFTLGGSFAGVITTDQGGKYDGYCTDTATLIDLVSGTKTPLTSAPCATFDHLVVGSTGDAAWHVRSSSVTSTYTAFADVACPSVSLCVATDATGRIATTSNPTGGAGAWTFQSGVGGSGVACPNTGLCVSVGGRNISTSTNPGAGTWASGATPATSLFQVGCPSSALCVAVGGNEIATSTDPAGGASTWTTTSLPGNHELYGIACPSTTLCVAIDSRSNQLFTSTDPTGGATTWTATPLAGVTSLLGGIACPSTSLCVITAFDGHLITSTNPAGPVAAWSVSSGAGPLTRVACPSVSECVSGTLSGFAWSANPGAGWSSWQAGYTGVTVVGISCPSTDLCVAVTADGQVTTSTNPLSGPAGWTSRLVDAPPCALATGCTLERLEAYDGQRTTTIDTAGPGPGNLIANLQLNGNVLSWRHAGSPRQTTLP